MADARQKLIGLLDYVEQVVRLDERVAFRMSEFRLPDGSTFAVGKAETQNLPGVRHDLRDEEGPVWLEVERLARKEPPPPPKEIAEWIQLSADPTRRPEARAYLLVTVLATERDAALAKGEVRADDVLEAPRKRGEPENAPPRFDLKLRLEDRPAVAAAIDAWIAGAWAIWSAEEMPRRRTIALYQQLYKIFQLLEVGTAESPIELMWGIGVVHWQKDGIIIDRPLLERRVEIELDDKHGGAIRVRPTSADALFDLKPYEELGCVGLASLSDLIRREIQRAAEEEGVSPFARASFETILSPAGARLDPDGYYAPEVTASSAGDARDAARLTVTDQWVLFARPRSQHVVLQDIERLRHSAADEEKPFRGLPERLVTEPSREAATGGWKPLSPNIGGSGGDGVAEPASASTGDIFFPKPFNDDQLEIIRRLSSADGLVVQGPPGTGKTHTIANLICHAMATGQRVLVVSRGEAALTVLKDQLPKEVQPLAIAVLSNERQGLRQIESAIREIQSVVEGTRPESRRATVARLEREIQGLQLEITKLDRELDRIAEAHLAKIGPRGETPSDLARRIIAEREAHAWFSDRPVRFASEAGISDDELTALIGARQRIGELLDHLGAVLPALHDVPATDVVSGWHADLVAAAQHEEVASVGPARALRVTADNSGEVLALARTLEDLARVLQAASNARWVQSVSQLVLKGAKSPLLDRLREAVREAAAIDAERAELLRRAVELPDGIADNEEARAAISRAAAGQKLWPIISIGKGDAKALVSQISLDGAAVRDGDVEAWRHVAAVVANILRLRGAQARWDSLAREIEAPSGQHRKQAIEISRTILRICDLARVQAPMLTAVTGNGFDLEAVIGDRNLCIDLGKQIGAAALAAKLAKAEEERRRTAALFTGADRTSTLTRQLLENVLGRPSESPEQVGAVWRTILQRLGELKNRSGDFATVESITAKIAAAGAPQWAKRLRTEKAVGHDTLVPVAWRDAWDHAAADAHLARIDERQRLARLAQEREAADRQCRKLFGELVRERTFYELDRRLSPSIKAALVEFVRALTRIGRGTGKTAWIHRRTARDAMARCYDAVPCWIMPTWRVAEQLPAELGALDLVIIDEASQSDVTELPALLRGKKILVVGDDRQVSPTAPFVTQEKIGQLRHHYLGDLPFKSLLEPGESIYDLMRAVFPNERLMLKEHFRCVEPIIQFSMQFYPEKMLPLRIPAAHERLDPPLVDIYIPHGSRTKNRKINHAEAEVIVEEIAALAARPEMKQRSIGVISLIGAEQAEHIRVRLSETVGEEVMQRHAILCGDSATFQGSERDIVFLSMVADPAHKTALTMLRYEQRFNVAVSRARDRVVLVRSVRREDLNPADLKAKLIAHFDNPMPELEFPDDVFAVCESGFERDLMQNLVERGYRVQGQVGSLGYRIDMVVEGAGGARLAIECDGDRYHGPEQWRHDMRRQRVLERVGWRFWRCFASSYYRDTASVIGDLVDTLNRFGIEPVKEDAEGRRQHRHTERRIIESSAMAGPEPPVGVSAEAAAPAEAVPVAGAVPSVIGIGDRVIVQYSDDMRRMTVRLTEGSNDTEKGMLSATSPLGKAIVGAEEGEEVEVRLDDGRQRRALIVNVEKSPASRMQARDAVSISRATV